MDLWAMKVYKGGQESGKFPAIDFFCDMQLSTGGRREWQ